MKKLYNPGKFLGLDIYLTPSVVVALLAVWALMALLFARQFAPVESIVGGLIAAILFLASEIFHQWGHAWAARQTGYPMTGIRIWGLSTSLYPPDEPPLPAEIHIRRALGGPIASILLAATAFAAFLLLNPPGDSLAGWLLLFVTILNMLVFGFGALLPLGFTDGSTLRYWWSRRKR